MIVRYCGVLGSPTVSKVFESAREGRRFPGEGWSRIGHASSKPEAARRRRPEDWEGALAPPEAAVRFSAPGRWLDHQEQPWSSRIRAPLLTTAWTHSWKSSRVSLTVAASTRASGKRWAGPGSQHVRAWASSQLLGPPGRWGALTAKVWRCRRIGGFYLCVKNRPRSFEGLLKLAVFRCSGFGVRNLWVQSLSETVPSFVKFLRREH